MNNDNKRPNSSKGINNKNDAFSNYVKTNAKNIKAPFNELKRQNNIGNSPMNKSYYNFPLMHKNMNIDEQIEKYQQNPHLQINLKIVGEGLKQKILEMNENETVDEKEISSPVCTKKFSKSIMKKYDFQISGNIHKTISINNEEEISNIRRRSFFMPHKDLELVKNQSGIDNNNIQKCNTNNIIQLNSCKIDKSNKRKKNSKQFNKNDLNKNKLKLYNKNVIDKYRLIKRKKPLYDSLDDNESNEEEEFEKVINPESNLYYILIYL